MIDDFDCAYVEFDAVAVALAWALAFQRPVVWFCVVYSHSLHWAKAWMMPGAFIDNADASLRSA